MTAVTKKFEWDFHIPPKADICAKFQLSRLPGGLARECDRRRETRSGLKLYPQVHIFQESGVDYFIVRDRLMASASLGPPYTITN